MAYKKKDLYDLWSRIIGSDKSVRRPFAAAVFLLTVFTILTLGPVMGLLVAPAALLIVATIRTVMSERALRRYQKHLPVVLDDVAQSLRTGSGFLTALDDAGAKATGELAGDIRYVVHQCAMGRTTTEALENWAQRCPVPSVRLCVGSMLLALETGGPRAQAVDAAGTTLRQALAAVDVAHTHAAQSKASAYVLTFLPLIVSGPMLATNGDARAFMFHSVLGQVLLVVGLALDALGAFWMSFLIKRAVT